MGGPWWWRIWAATGVVALACLAMVACSPLDPPQREGSLILALLPEAETLQLPDGSTGPGFTEELATEFAASLGVPLRTLPVSSADELEQVLRQGRAHLGAYLSPRPVPEGIVFSQAIVSSPLWVVTHNDFGAPSALTELVGQEVHVVAGSPAAIALETLPDDKRPTVVAHADLHAQALLVKVAQREIAYAAVDELNLRIAANIQPELLPALRLFGQSDQALAVPRCWGKEFQDALDGFLTESQTNGYLKRLHDKHYGHVQRVSPAMMSRFIADARTVLPRFRRDFQLAQERTGLDWRLLAALAYQESHWDPLATSSTNVRGIMMLTEDTADHWKVDNRLDPAQSIRGGAQLLRHLVDQLPDSIAETDRLWFALAAYNLGMGHLNGGRIVAQSMGKDADNWYDMKSVLPLLSRPEVYARLKSGRARGGEAVILVENVRSLFGVLSHIEPPHRPLVGGNGLHAEPPKPVAGGSGLRSGGGATGLKPPSATR